MSTPQSKAGFVQNCLIPFPGDDLDPVGQRIRDMEAAIDNLREVNIKRLYGDSVRIAAAAIQLHSMAEDLTRLAREVIDQPMAAE